MALAGGSMQQDVAREQALDAELQDESASLAELQLQLHKVRIYNAFTAHSQLGHGGGAGGGSSLFASEIGGEQQSERDRRRPKKKEPNFDFPEGE